MSAMQSGGVLKSLGKLLIAPLQASQGLHIDPETAEGPDPDSWSAGQREAWFSPEMPLLKTCVSYKGAGPRESILAELAEYHAETEAEAYEKCIHWEALSIREWKAADRSTPEGLQDFYDTTTSWRYDLSWYAYLQVTGYAFPQAIALGRFMKAHGIKGDLLDFGSGIGLNAQAFSRFGYNVTLADVSKPLLDYAIWRCARHGDQVRALPLRGQPLPRGAYDIVTAFDVLVHVPDFDATAADLHRTIRPGGWLFANFDTRANDDASAWHLHNNAFDLDRRLKQAGFVKRATIGGFLGCYQRVDPATAGHRLRTSRDKVVAPTLHFVSLAKRFRWPTPTRIRKLAGWAWRRARGQGGSRLQKA